MHVGPQAQGLPRMSPERGEAATLSKAVISGRYSVSSAVGRSSPNGVLNVTRSLRWGNIYINIWEKSATFLQLPNAASTNTCCVI